MKLMPLLLLTIFFLVTTGKANALESTIEEDRDIVEYEEPLTTMWCKLNKDVWEYGCMDDKHCLDKARGQCDWDPHCYGVSWYRSLLGQKIKLCLSRDMAPKKRRLAYYDEIKRMFKQRRRSMWRLVIRWQYLLSRRI